MCWLLIGGVTLGARDQGCLGGSSGGTCVGKSVYRRNKERQEWAAGDLQWDVCLQKETEKGKNGQYLCMGPFMDPFYGLTSNFSCPYNLLWGDLQYHILSIHSLTSGLLSCLHLWLL
jgi:hypothetical protein